MSSILYPQHSSRIPSGAVILDSHGIVQGYDPAWLELAPRFGLPDGDTFIGQNYSQCGSISSLVPDIETQIDNILSGKAEDFCVQVACGTDGAQHVLEIAAAAWGEEQNEVVLRHRQREFMGKNLEKWMAQDSLQSMFEKLGAGVIFQSLSGDIELVNKAASDMLGAPFDSLLDPLKIDDSLNLVDGLGGVITWRDFPGFSALENGISHQGFVLGVNKGKNASRAWLRVDTGLLYEGETHTVLGAISTLTDISLERKIHEEINRVTDRLRLALDGANIGIWDWYVKEEKMVWDDRMYALYGHEGKTHLSVREVWERSVGNEDKEKIIDLMSKLCAGKDKEHTDFCVNLSDGKKRYLRAQARAIPDDTGKIFRIVGINWDVTKEIETQRRLKEMAFQDELTQLPNRVAFNFELNKIIEQSENNIPEFTVLVMDLDNFKDINDSFGHPTGDSVLCEVVNRVTPLLESSDLFARLSGDEFGILILNGCEREACEKFAQTIQAALAEPFYLPNGPAINIKVSVGMSCYPENASDAVDLVKTADLAMYRSKGNGRDCITWYNKEMSVALTRKVTLENKIREALRDEEFSLYYQPIVDLQTLDVIGCEALIRWFDKNGDFISPAEFIPVAESCGLIYELGSWINFTAFKQFKLWQVLNTSLSYVSVNVSPHQLQYAHFHNDLLEAIDKTGVNPANVQLEITEGTFLQESMNAGSQLKEFADAGFHLAIDDFGTGYSSLSYLKRFNVDVIKIDKSFIDDIETDQADKDIVKAIMAMTSSLGFKTLVEGVERAEQAEIVKSYGCGFAQGYYYGRPLHADEFAETFIGVKEKGRS